jgi:hypothetical protein
MDEILEILVTFLRNVLSRFVIPITSQEELMKVVEGADAAYWKKILSMKTVKHAFGSLCGVLESLSKLIRKQVLQDTWLVHVTSCLFPVLFTKKASFVHLPIAEVLMATFGAYEGLRPSIMQEILQHLHLITNDMNQAIGSRKRKIKSHNYKITAEESVSFATFIIIQLIQSCTSNPERVAPESLAYEYDESQKYCHYFV